MTAEERKKKIEEEERKRRQGKSSYDPNENKDKMINEDGTLSAFGFNTGYNSGE